MRVGSEQGMVGCGEALARKLARGDGDATVIELVGDVGAGKTTLTRGLAKGLGVADAVTSPSFTLSKEYALPSGGRLVHYDFYRLDEPGIMAEDLTENLRDARNVVVIEWGESVAELLPEGHFRVEIQYCDDGGREVRVFKMPEGEEVVLDAGEKKGAGNECGSQMCGKWACGSQMCGGEGRN